MSLKEDFAQWKRHPVTVALLLGLDARATDLKEALVVDAGKDPLFDRYRAGYLQAIADFSDVDVLEDKEGA